MTSRYKSYAWKIAEQDRGRARELAASAGVPPLVAHLLLLRGVESPEAADRFLHPSMQQLSDPFLLTDMDLAVARIAQARDRNEAVLVFGDYDVDGISATAILVNALRRFGLTRIHHGMPLRLTEGYGLAPEHVDAACEKGAGLIITVDNGISSCEAALHAREIGVDLIVTDHHSIEGDLPDAAAVVNPKREDRAYAGYHLCGAGVAFKLSTALNGTPNDLDLASLGTVADIVPLAGENRLIVALGLRHIAKHRRLGIAKLAEVARADLAEITAEKIAFQLSPRLNAAGRLGDGMLALELLLSEDSAEAAHIAKRLDEANVERRAIENSIYDEAAAELDACFLPKQRSIVLARRGWHAGVIGIVASRVQTHYSRPALLIAIDEEGVGRGSARSGPGFDMMSALTPCQGFLERFGGHRSAAGFTIPEQSVDAFRDAFEQQAFGQLGEGEIVTELNVDAIASFSEIDSALLKAMELLEPIGHQNPAPVLCSMSVELVPKSTRVLKDRHLKLSLRQGGRVFPAIGFSMAERFYREDMPRQLDAAYTPQFNTWRGETTIQLNIKDLRPAESG